MKTNLELLKEYLKEIISDDSEVDNGDYNSEEEGYYIRDWGLEIVNDSDDKTWSVYEWVSIPQTRWEPEDVDVVKVSVHKSFWKAMEDVLIMIIKKKMAIKAENSYYEELAEEPKWEL
jgi:hypothetical protein